MYQTSEQCIVLCEHSLSRGNECRCTGSIMYQVRTSWRIFGRRLILCPRSHCIPSKGSRRLLRSLSDYQHLAKVVPACKPLPLLSSLWDVLWSAILSLSEWASERASKQASKQQKQEKEEKETRNHKERSGRRRRREEEEEEEKRGTKKEQRKNRKRKKENLRTAKTRTAF